MDGKLTPNQSLISRTQSKRALINDRIGEFHLKTLRLRVHETSRRRIFNYERPSGHRLFFQQTRAALEPS